LGERKKKKMREEIIRLREGDREGCGCGQEIKIYAACTGKCGTGLRNDFDSPFHKKYTSNMEISLSNVFHSYY
jgi:hypothetical protein